MSDHIFRIRFNIGGGHVHCRLFAAKNRQDPQWAKCGDFTVCKGTEFRDLIAAFKADVVGDMNIDACAESIDEACTP